MNNSTNSTESFELVLSEYEAVFMCGYSIISVIVGLSGMITYNLNLLKSREDPV